MSAGNTVHEATAASAARQGLLGLGQDSGPLHGGGFLPG